MHVLFLIAGMAFAEKNIERDFRVAESATVIGGVFAIVSAVSYRQAKNIEDQMLRESNNYNYNELLQSYKGHRNQYIVAVPATIVFSGLAVALYTRRNIKKTTFSTSPSQPKSNITDSASDTTSTVVLDSENEMNQDDSIQKDHIEKKSLPKYQKILDFIKKEESSQELPSETKGLEQPNKEQSSSEKLGKDEDSVLENGIQSQEQLEADQQEK